MSNNSGPSAAQVAQEMWRKTQIQRLKALSPAKYDHYQNIRQKERLFILACVFGIGGMALLILISSEGESLILCMFLVFIAIALIGVFGNAASDEFLERIEMKQLKADDDQSRIAKRMANSIDELKQLKTGDTIIAHEGAIVINRSTLVDSLNKLNGTDDSIADALKTIAGYIENYKLNEAQKPFENLHVAISEKKDPTLIRAIWNDLVSIAPEIATLTKAAATITSLFI